MLRTLSLALPLGATLVGCGVGDPDARVVASLYTGTCDWSGSEWLGVQRVGVAVEYAPGTLADRSLPGLVGTCSLDTALFPDESRFDGGADLPKLEGDPSWESTSEGGSLSKARDGLWTGSVSPSGGCGTIGEVAADGLTLNGAGALDGLRTPVPGDPGLVYVDGELDHDWGGVLQQGNPLPLSWTAGGWDESFVQIRQVGGGTVRQTLTCNTTGLSSFRVDNSVWEQLENVGAETIEVYVGFQNVVTERQGGESVESITRVVHVLQPEE